jgi:tripartite-type tricarboxylate transporter receptor subunit TctC
MSSNSIRTAVTIARTFCALAIVFGSSLASAQGWPTKPVRMVVPFTPGGPTDILARVLAERLSRSLGQQIVVDNKGGSGGTIGTAEVARSPADGYTLLFTTSSTHAIAPHLQKLPYNPVSDFTPIAHVADAPLVLLASSSANVKSVGELVALARQKPGTMNFASSGNGTISHLTMEAFKARTGIDIVHVPYRGGAPALPDLMAGTVSLLFNALPGVMEQTKTGRLRALAITSAKRSPLAPEVPTVSEAGVPGFTSFAWFGLYGPKGMSPEVVKRLNTEVNTILKSPDAVSSLAKLGAEPGHGSPSEFASMVAADSDRWKKLIAERKITLD